MTLARIRVDVEGHDNVPDMSGVIVAFNHLSFADPALVAVAMERHARRRVRFMAKAEALQWPVLGRLMRAYGGFGVRRGRLDRDAYRTAREVLRSTDWLGLAPEGTRSRTGTLGAAHTGAVLLAQRTGATLLPVGISGSERVWPVGALLPRPGRRATLRIGEAYRPGTGNAEAETAELMRRIAALLPPAYRGMYG